MKSSIAVKAHAKINLCLNVKGRREDGYHDLEMVMVPLLLHDDIVIRLADADRLCCDDKTLLLDDTNTITKAIMLMRDTYHIKEHFVVELKKRIPMQAGLAGGSSDAAAVMRGINDLLGLHIPLTELAHRSKKIGADVPFCVMDTCAVVEGIGEYITPFDMNCDVHILLVKPSAGVPTGKAFQMLDIDKCEHPSCFEMRDACRKNRFYDMCAALGNSLEYSAFQIVPEIAEIKRSLQLAGFDGVLMSGSGSTVFALTRDECLLQRTVKEWEKRYPFVLATRIYKKE